MYRMDVSRRTNESQSRSVAVCLFSCCLADCVIVSSNDSPIYSEIPVRITVMHCPISLSQLQLLLLLLMKYEMQIECAIFIRNANSKTKVCKGKMHRERERAPSQCMNVWVPACLFPIKCTKKTQRRTGGRTENIVAEVVTYSLFMV